MLFLHLVELLHLSFAKLVEITNSINMVALVEGRIVSTDILGSRFILPHALKVVGALGHHEASSRSYSNLTLSNQWCFLIKI